MRLILASGSPRRRDLLQSLGETFEVISSDIDEVFNPVLHTIGERVSDLACQKALAVAEGLGDSLVLGADTIVYLAGETLGKPQDAADAERMLSALGGGWHEVVTGVAIVRQQAGTRKHFLGHAVSRVRMRALNREEIRAYIASGEPMDKAGAYAIQGGAGGFVAEIDGSYENIVGLPLELTRELLARARAAD